MGDSLGLLAGDNRPVPNVRDKRWATEWVRELPLPSCLGEHGGEMWCNWGGDSLLIATASPDALLALCLGEPVTEGNIVGRVRGQDELSFPSSRQGGG
mmetsp:Transcript_32843/g.80099  ORF Transcript_32843/g.80099 Transcript_32843/m.80099 type:complete len:98 (-) Transcript_32843:83-376(-)